MVATMVEHDHTGQEAVFGLCLTCADGTGVITPVRIDPTEQLALSDPSFEAAGADSGNHTAQMVRLLTVVGDGRWRSVATIADETGDPQRAVLARLVELGSPEFGCWVVRERVTLAGMVLYRATQG